MLCTPQVSCDVVRDQPVDVVPSHLSFVSQTTGETVKKKRGGKKMPNHSKKRKF